MHDKTGSYVKLIGVIMKKYCNLGNVFKVHYKSWGLHCLQSVPCVLSGFVSGGGRNLGPPHCYFALAHDEN